MAVIRLRRIPTAALVLLGSGILLAVIAPQVAVASNNNGYKTAYRDFRVNYQDLTNNFRLAGDYTINNNVNPTDLNVNAIDVNTQRPVNLLDEDYSPLTWYGLWECVDSQATVGDTICEIGNTYHNLRYSYSGADARSLVCEEFGHAVGLAHNFDHSNTCMARPVQWGEDQWNTHERTIINSKY